MQDPKEGATKKKQVRDKRISAKPENRCVVVTEEGSYLRLVDVCITQLKAQGPSKTCNESKEAEEEGGPLFGPAAHLHRLRTSSARLRTGVPPRARFRTGVPPWARFRTGVPPRARFRTVFFPWARFRTGFTPGACAAVVLGVQEGDGVVAPGAEKGLGGGCCGGAREPYQTLDLV